MDKADNSLEQPLLTREEMNADKKDELEEAEGATPNKGKIYCGITLKRKASWSALVAIPGLYFTQVCAGVFTNAQIVFLLRNPDYFQIDPSEMGRITTRTLLAQLVAQILVSIGIGYVYDIFGRRITITLSFIVLALSLFIIPLCTTVMTLSLARMLLGIGI